MFLNVFFSSKLEQLPLEVSGVTNHGPRAVYVPEKFAYLQESKGFTVKLVRF
jgi:hypothetical protein